MRRCEHSCCEEYLGCFLLEFEYSGADFWARAGQGRSTLAAIDARSLAKTLRWMSDAGYFCFMQGRSGLLPVSPPCWRDELEVRRWSNLACAHDPAVVAALLKMGPASGRTRSSS